MAPRRNECLGIATEELIEDGVPFDVSYGGKHLLVRFQSHAGDPQLITLSKNGDTSPRSYAWIKNECAQQVT